jgi:hypothetical protein
VTRPSNTRPQAAWYRSASADYGAKVRGASRKLGEFAFSKAFVSHSAVPTTTAMKGCMTPMKSAAVGKMMNSEAVAIEMVPAVIMVVVIPAKDKVAATVWSPTAKI